MIKTIINNAFVAIVQLAAFVCLYEILLEAYKEVRGGEFFDISWGLFIWFVFGMYVVFVILYRSFLIFDLRSLANILLGIFSLILFYYLYSSGSDALWAIVFLSLYGSIAFGRWIAHCCMNR